MSLRHEMVLASAGTGKTYQLTLRYLGLLAEGVPPDQIIALTFTRKAAGEFTSRILGRLAEAAGSEKEAKRLAADLHKPDLTKVRCHQLLRTVVEHLHRLQLGTIDSFFQRLLRAYGPELGCPPALSILGEEEAIQRLEETLRRLFLPASWKDRDPDLFLDAFRRAFNGEEKSILSSFGNKIQSFQWLYRNFPGKEHWETFNEGPRGLTQDLVNQIAAVLEAIAKDHSQGHKLRILSALFQQKASLRIFLAEEKTLTINFLHGLGELTDGTALREPGLPGEEHDVFITINRRKTWVKGEQAAVLRAGFRALLDEYFANLSATTSATRRLVAIFEEIYQRTIRETGQLTFSDSAFLLADGFLQRDVFMTAFETSRRLDAQLQHWLIDEFQDTSRLQWQILKPLADEVLQATPPYRSFFLVGDLKQSIYSWRGGDPTLFSEIRDHYNQAGEDRITERNLDVSWRSRPAVIEAVNTIFNPAASWPDWLSSAVRKSWKRNWQPHKAAHADTPGWVSMQRFPISEHGIWGRVCDLLKDHRPWERGLKVAILCRKNNDIAEGTEFLRSHLDGVDVFSPAEVRPAESCAPVVAALALLRFIRNPVDGQSLVVLKSAPYPAWLPEEEGGRLNLTHFRQQISRWGLAEVWDSLAKAFADKPLTPFEEDCWKRIATLAHQLDASDDSSLGNFLKLTELLSFKQENPHAEVQILTIHRSKGLDFDWVILPLDPSRGLVQTQRSILVETDEPFRILERPHQDLSPFSGWVQAALEKEADKAFFESLCVEYVALTRAKLAVTLLVELAKEGTTRGTYQFLRSAMELPDFKSEKDRLFERGDEAAFRTFQWTTIKPAAAGSGTALPPLKRLADPPVTLTRSLPSEGESGGKTQRPNFRFVGQSAARLGSQIHAWFQNLEWMTPESLETLKRDYGKSTDPLGERIREVLKKDWLIQLLMKPEEGQLPAVLRELPFEMVDGTRWTSGVIDRIHLYTDTAGTLEKAVIFDFKSHERPEPEHLRSHFKGQMDTYRIALSRLHGITLDKIECALLPIQGEGPIWL